MDVFFISDLHLFYYWGDVSLIEWQIDANIERIPQLDETVNKYPTAHEFHEPDSNNKE